MNDGNIAVNSPKDLCLNFNEVHFAITDLSGKVTELASFDAPFACGCRGCEGCRGCRGCEGCRGCRGCEGCGCRGCEGCRGCRGCEGCRGCH
jgi:hypothetical protein